MKFPYLILCLALLLPSGLAAQNTSSSGSQYFHIVSRDKYRTGANDPLVPGECLPIKNGFVPPTFGKACRTYDSNSSSSGASGSGGGSSGSSSSGNSTTSSSGSSSSTGSSSGSGSSSGTGDCPAPGQAVVQENPIACDNGEDCTKDCVDSTVCIGDPNHPDTGTLETVHDCHCQPSCTIQDPVNYPYCCTVEDKPGYPCLKICTMPNGDKVDIEENPPRCKKFKDCCYGKKDAQNNCIKKWDPVETEPGDPRDYCKMKCVDVCEDLLEVDRSKTASDIFPECCTPPIPIEIACACCREPANQPSTAYCEYFRRFFSCDAAVFSACPADHDSCSPSVPNEPAQYDAQRDPSLTFDPRFAFCSGEWTNRNCRYICRGHDILMGADAPTEGIWAKDYVDDHGNPIENNYALEVHGNCTDDEGQEKPIPWPPANQDLEECGPGSITTNNGGVTSCP